MDTLTRTRTEVPAEGAQAITWVVSGPGGAVSFTVIDSTTPQSLAIGLHYPPERVAETMACEYLPSGTCFPDSSFTHGHALAERWSAGGREDQVVYAELESWYRDRMTTGA